MKPSTAPLYPWQTAHWQQLQAYVLQQRIPQALLLTGRAGLGKRQLADQYAAALLCQTAEQTALACGECSSCQLLTAGTHPDYLRIAPEETGKAIGIDQIRQLNQKLALKPQFERYRVVVIEPADALNVAAANAFLKCLEEPTERTCFILLGQYASRLPATIRSRCQKLVFLSPAAEQSRRWLAEQGVSGDADMLLEMALGSPLLALDYAQTDKMALRQQLFQDWLKMAASHSHLAEIAERWQKFDQIELERLLSWLALWLADLLKLALAGPSARIGSRDLQASLQQLAAKLDLKGLYRYYDTVLTSRAKLTTTLNKQLLIEALLLDWWQLNNR